MKSEHGHRAVSLKPSDATAISPVIGLNTKDKVLVKHLTDDGLDSFLASYIAPPYDDTARLDLTLVPIAWASVIRNLSLPHIFFYATVLASQDKLLQGLTDARIKATDKCLHELGEFGLLWLGDRPHYSPKTTVDKSRWHFPTWDAETKSWMGKLSRDNTTTSRQLLITYSTEALLGSSIDLGVFRDGLEKEVAGWKAHLKEETALILQKFSLV